MNAHPSRSHADKPASATHPAEGRATGSACGVELLAPAGSMAALHAAVSAGADAVYLGMESFNARRGADNFTAETLAEACAYAHLRGARVYVTMNIAVLPDEVRAALDAACRAYRAGVDAFIVQDLGLVSLCRQIAPEVPVPPRIILRVRSRSRPDCWANERASAMPTIEAASETWLASLAA